MRGDTLSFLADSFKVREGASVEDLLKRLPGLSVNSRGEITAQGKRVEKVLVDGDEFFGDDPTLATRNLQALAVKEVEVFDKKSDQATFTGVDDGEATKTINLKLKDEFKKGYFGKVKLGGGLPERFENQLMINSFKDKRKLSVYGIGANTNKTQLGWQESDQFGGGIGTNMEVGDDGSIMMWSSSDEFGGVGGFDGEGLPTAWTLGGSYANKWDNNKSSALGSYRYQNMRTIGNFSNSTQNILPDTQFFNNQRGRAEAERWRHKGLFKTELYIDSMNSIDINASLTYGRTQSVNTQFSEALTADGQPVNTSDRATTNLSDYNNFSGSILYKRKFAKARRTLSANLSTTANNENGNGNLLTYNDFFIKGLLVGRDTIDQKKESDINASTLAARLSYTEPIGKKGILEIKYGINVSNSKNSLLSFDKVDGKYDALNDTFSNSFRFKTLAHTIGTGYRYSGTKLNFGFGSDVAFTSWEQIDLFRNTVTDYVFTNFFPRANVSYKLGTYSRVSLNYNGNTRAPSINQLQPVANNNDPLNITIGNPDLQQSFSHNVNLSYNSWKMTSGTGMWASAFFNTVSNDFGIQSFVDSIGRRINQTINVNGNYRMGGYMGYNKSFKKSGINFDVYLNPTISRQVSIVNSQLNNTNSQNWSVGVNGYKSFKEKVDVSLRQSASYNVSKSSIRPDLDTRFWTTNSEFEMEIQLPLSFTLGNEVNYNWRQQTEVFANNNNAFLWNINLEKKVSKKQDMRVGIHINDILNQNIGFNRDIGSNFISERTYDVIRRYWLLTFNWNFNKGPRKAEEEW